ncbi:glycosyltransferase [Fervidobacterium riparium]|uniref:Glycosyltransferase involved in cell wall bisynthesis n=1 Tax=Fervidobacterium gondwanense DSM 13020 TaxID=1121883 RepID=A0A1M7THT7_FERGO|nr:glycosyltransferase [Fervidobacterium gondwanense]UXF01788.1 hypothetical protein IB67_09785 [Fervidobacterium riparium]SHN70241.1 Glycosyltransferase involved in cell wall bisynthesis [Fervidobacterium gondwanense DSM 13020]
MRVLHAPIEIAGQLWEYTDALRKVGVNARKLTFEEHPFGYKDDIIIKITGATHVYDLVGAEIKIFTELVNSFDIFHFHFGESLIHQNLDLPALKFMGKKVLMNFWGSDVRLKSIAKQKNPFYSDEMHLGDDNLKIEKLKIISRFVDCAVISDYELYEYIEPFFKNIKLIRQAVDTEVLQPKYPEPVNERPVIVHAPSRTNVKGTSFVENAIEKLLLKYNFEYIRLSGLPHDKVLSTILNSDIVIDQVILGAHGILSVEAMALGKPVVCYIREDLIDKYPSDLPLVNATPVTLEEEIEKLLQSGELRHEIGKRSRKYVENYHSKITIGLELKKLYETL